MGSMAVGPQALMLFQAVEVMPGVLLSNSRMLVQVASTERMRPTPPAFSKRSIRSKAMECAVLMPSDSTRPFCDARSLSSDS